MEEFIGNASSAQLLGLMAIPLIGVAIIVVFVVVYYTRQANRARNQLGQPKQTALPSAERSRSQDLDLGLLFSKNDNGEIIVADESNPTSQTMHSTADRQLSPPDAAEPEELLRLLREPRTGQLIVEVGGNRYSKLTDVTDKKIGQFILKLVAHLLVFTNGVIVTKDGMKSIYLPRVAQVPDPIPGAAPRAEAVSATVAPLSEENPDPSKPPPEAEAAFLASLQKLAPSKEPSPPRPAGLFTSRSAVSEPGLELNLAEEINDIVQARLRYSPLDGKTKLEISSGPSGGIIIQVDHEFYNSPDEIPDEAVKALIKASIQEWERN